MFSPAIRQIPRGEAADRLRDTLVLLAGTEGFFELKRNRDRSVKPYFD
ncbi:mycothiol-dependent nitroreductase Rv2466c family protein [Nonomuraea fuscirosea]